MGLAIITVVGTFRYPDDNIIPSWVFDITLLILFFYHLINHKTLSKFSLIAAFIFLLYSSINIFSEVSILERTYILRPWIYILIFATIAPRLYLKSSFLGMLTIFMVTKYVIIISAFGLHSRPGFFQEINYDLLILIIIFITETNFRNHYIKTPKTNIFSNISVALIVLGSLSRSGLIAYSLTYIKTQKIIRIIILAALFFIIFLFISLFFRPENEGLSGIDRYIWAQYFLNAFLSDYKVLIFGNHPIEYLSSQICKEFMQFEGQYLGFKGDKCLSNVFTSHILRFPYEYGLLGFTIFYFLIYKVFRKISLPKSYCLLTISLLLANGLSVSSLSSAYSFIGLLYMTSRINSFRYPLNSNS